MNQVFVEEAAQLHGVDEHAVGRVGVLRQIDDGQRYGNPMLVFVRELAAKQYQPVAKNGLQVFDHNRAFSHQQSDKISDGRAYNIYDLVRVHKFGYLDKDGEVKRSKEAMEELINNDPVVKANRGNEFTLKAMKVGGMSPDQIKESKAKVDDILDVEQLT